MKRASGPLGAAGKLKGIGAVAIERGHPLPGGRSGHMYLLMRAYEPTQ